MPGSTTSTYTTTHHVCLHAAVPGVIYVTISHLQTVCLPCYVRTPRFVADFTYLVHCLQPHVTLQHTTGIPTFRSFGWCCSTYTVPFTFVVDLRCYYSLVVFCPYLHYGTLFRFYSHTVTYTTLIPLTHISTFLCLLPEEEGFHTYILCW